MARIIEAEARISAIDATGEVFQKVAQKVRGLAGTMKSFGTSANAFSGGVNRSIGRVHGAMRTLAPVAAGAASFEAMRGVRDIVHDAVQATASRAHEAARMEVSGMSQSEIADAERVSQQLSERYRALSTTTIMHALRNMRAIVGTYEEAGKILDPILKLRIAAMGAHPERAEALSEDFDQLVKGMEIKGVTMDPAKFASYINGMAKAINVFGDTLNPTDYYQMFKFGRQATQNLSEKFMLETAPTLAQELGGMSAGRAMSSFYQAIVGGRIKEQSVRELDALGLVNQNRVVRTKSGSIKGLLPGGIVGSQLAASDPYAWVNQVLLPALQKHGITDKGQIQAVIGTIFQQATAAQMAGIFATQQARIQKDWNLVHGAQGSEAADVFMSKDPFVAWKAVTEQLQNLFAIAGGPLAAPAARGLNLLAEGIVKIENAAAAHSKIAAGTLAAGTVGLLGAAGAAGLWALRGMYGVGKRLAGAGEAAVEDLSGTDAIRVMQSALPGAAEAGPSLLGTIGTTAGMLGMLPAAAGASIWAGGKAQDYFGNKPDVSSVPGVGYVPGMPIPEVKGNADLNVSVQVEPSDSFISRIVSAIRNDINVFSSAGTAGSTGVSMPEATPNP